MSEWTIKVVVRKGDFAFTYETEISEQEAEETMQQLNARMSAEVESHREDE